MEYVDEGADMDKFLQQKTKAQAMKELELEINFIFSDIMMISSMANTQKRHRHTSNAELK